MLIGYLLLAIAAQAQTIPVTVPAGTRLRVKLETPVNTKRLLSDHVEATLIEPISLRGEEALPAVTHLSGRITDVQQKGGAVSRASGAYRHDSWNERPPCIAASSYQVS